MKTKVISLYEETPNQFLNNTPTQKIAHLGPKSQKLPQNQIKVRIEENIESETWVDPKTVFEPFPNPKNYPLGPKKSKMTPKLSQKQM